MRIFFTFLALLAGGYYAFSQNTLSGTVSDPSGLPLESAHIHIGSQTTFADSDGQYRQSGIETGQQHLLIEYIGYKSLDTLISITENTLFNAVLKPQATKLEEVVISANGTGLKNTVHEQRLTTETLERYSNQSLGYALKEIAGVSSLKTGSTIVKPVINGLHSSRVPVIANNVRLEDQQWGTEHAPNIDINSAGKVSVIKGAAALQYGGDAIGGVVITEPVQVLKDTLFGKTIVNLASNGRGGSIASSLHKGNDKGWAWNASGTFKYLGDRETPDYVLSNTGNREQNFAADLKFIGESYDVSASYSIYDAVIGIAKATHIGNISDLVRAINSGEPAFKDEFTYTIGAPRQEVQHHLAKLNLNQRFSESSTLAVQYAFQYNRRKEFDIRRNNYKDIPALDLTLVTHILQADWKKEINAVTVKAGVNAAAQNNKASQDTGIRPLIPDYTKYDAGAYGIVLYPLSDSFTAEAGARYDFSRMEATKFYQKTRWDSQGYNGRFDKFITADYVSQWLTKPEYTYHNFSASLGLRKNFGEEYSLFANAGLAMRNPNPSELFSDGLHHSNGTIELGDLGIEKEKAVKASITLVKNSGRFTFEANPYINAITDFIYLSPTSIEYTIRGAFPVYRYQQANAIMAGVDFRSGFAVTEALHHTFTFAYVQGSTTHDNKPLIDMPPANITNALRYTFKEWHSLYLELKSEAVLRQRRYPDNNFIADLPVNGQQVATVVDVSTPPAGYHLLHFNSVIQFTTSKNTSAAVGLSVSNIFNTFYRDYLNRQRLYTDEPGRNIMLQLKFNY